MTKLVAILIGIAAIVVLQLMWSYLKVPGQIIATSLLMIYTFALSSLIKVTNSL